MNEVARVKSEILAAINDMDYERDLRQAPNAARREEGFASREGVGAIPARPVGDVSALRSALRPS